LPGRHPGKEHCVVELVTRDMEIGMSRSGKGDLQGIGLLDGAIRLDDDHLRWRETYHLGGGRTAQNQVNDVLK
jgi:hypothetical protein